jgi:hypothetical protein
VHGTKQQTKAAWRPDIAETERLLRLAEPCWRGKSKSEIARSIGVDAETFSAWLMKTRASVKARPHAESMRFVRDLQKLEKRPTQIKDGDARAIRARARALADALAAVLPAWPNAPLPEADSLLRFAPRSRENLPSLLLATRC